MKKEEEELIHIDTSDRDHRNLSSSKFNVGAYFDSKFALNPISSLSFPSLLSNLTDRSNQINQETEDLFKNSIYLFDQQRNKDDNIHNLLTSHQSTYYFLHSSLVESLKEFNDMFDRFCSLNEEWSSVERNMIYSQLIDKCEELSDSARKEAETSPQHAVKSLVNLTKLYFQLKLSLYNINYIKSTLFDRLKYLLCLTKTQLFTSYSHTLNSINWPQTQQKLLKLDDPVQIQQLTELTEAVIILQAEEVNLTYNKNDNSHNNNYLSGGNLILPSSSSLDMNMCLPDIWIVDLLVGPILKRFDYHFSSLSNKPTNVLSKPEFYLSYVSKLIEDHYLFLDRYIQPIVNRANISATEIQIVPTFINSILNCVRIKFRSDFVRLQSDDSIFRHTIDEYILFENKLRSELHYPEPYPGILIQLIEKPSTLEYWIKVEKSWVNSKLEEILDMEDKWNIIKEESSNDISENRNEKKEEEVEKKYLIISRTLGHLINLSPHHDHMFLATRSSHSLLSLISSVTDRYRLLPLLSCRLRFLQDIQFQLLDIYRDECYSANKYFLKDLEKSKGKTHWFKWSGVYNSVIYVENVMKEWSDEPLFIELKYFQSNPQIFNSQTSPFQLEEYIANQNKKTNNFIFEGSLFDPLLFTYDELKQEMSQGICQVTITLFHRVTKEYRYIGHHFKLGEGDYELEDDIESELEGNNVVSDIESTLEEKNKSELMQYMSSSNFDLSSQLSDGVLLIKSQLIELFNSLSHSSFTGLCRQLAVSLDRYIYQEVIQLKWFSKIGIKRLKNDVTIIIMQFQTYLDKPTQYFPHCLESLNVLLLPLREAWELYSTLISFSYLITSEVEQKVMIKQKFKSSHLNHKQIKDLLEHRSDGGFVQAEKINVATTPSISKAYTRNNQNQIKTKNPIDYNINVDIISNKSGSTESTPIFTSKDLTSSPSSSPFPSSPIGDGIHKASRFTRLSAKSTSVLSSAASSFTKLLSRPLYPHVKKKFNNNKQEEQQSGHREEVHSSHFPDYPVINYTQSDREITTSNLVNNVSLASEINADKNKFILEDDWEWGEEETKDVNDQRFSCEKNPLNSNSNSTSLSASNNSDFSHNKIKTLATSTSNTDGWDID